jgi:hypothetical protein
MIVLSWRMRSARLSMSSLMLAPSRARPLATPLKCNPYVGCVLGCVKLEGEANGERARLPSANRGSRRDLADRAPRGRCASALP